MSKEYALPVKYYNTQFLLSLLISARSYSPWLQYTAHPYANKTVESKRSTDLYAFLTPLWPKSNINVPTEIFLGADITAKHKKFVLYTLEPYIEM